MGNCCGSKKNAENQEYRDMMEQANKVSESASTSESN